MKAERFAPYVVLRAVDVPRGESVNAGVVLFDGERILVGMAPDTTRLKALHPDLSVLDLRDWGAKLERTLLDLSRTVPDLQQQIAMLQLLCRPFTPDTTAGMTQINEDPLQALNGLLSWHVLARRQTTKMKRVPVKKQTKLGNEIRRWLKGMDAFSLHMDDLSERRAVANYPINVESALYADLAVKGDTLSVIEIMDLREVRSLTPTMKGEAAIKGLTLHEAKTVATPIAVYASNDPEISRHAIRLMTSYADDHFDLTHVSERDRFARFLGKALGRSDIAETAFQPVLF